MAGGFVYMMASKKGGTLYVGVTSDLAHRVDQHINGIGST
ncbi:MAG: GIY-YIG nuclease family protein, partial [Pseudomonadota bacterium]